jgi:3-hydroxyanthranilate 3,4-dioxygenase
MRTFVPPFSLQSWIQENRDLLKPPVGNKVIFKDSNFIVMAVGGPNQRTDFHVNQTDEFFYQLEGDIFLRLYQPDKGVFEVPIKQGDIFMLPAGIPHSPQRSENSVGLVVEMTREKGSQDALEWYCSACHERLYQESFHLTNIEKDFGAVFDRYFNGPHTLCPHCGHQNGREWNPPKK